MLSAWGLAALVLVGGVVTMTVAQDACSFIPDGFSCTSTNLHKYGTSCTCLSCSEIDGVGSYQCTGTTLCAADYQWTASTCLGCPGTTTNTTWWLRAYISIAIVFIAISALVYAALRVLVRFKRMIKDDTDKDSDEPGRRLQTRVYAYVYDWALGSLYRVNGTVVVSLRQFWIAGCELLDCFWCCTKRQDDDDEWRPLYLRAMRLLASLSIGASLGVMFGSLDFDSLKCRNHVNRSFWATGAESGESFVICDDGPAILDAHTLISTSSIVAFITTQGVKYIGSYAYRVSAPKTKLDIIAHGLWLTVALAAFPICIAVSSQLLHPHAYEYKSSKLRVEMIVSVTLSTWIKDQVADLIKMPFIFGFKTLLNKCVPTPQRKEKSQVVEPMPCELTPPTYNVENIDEDKKEPPVLELDELETLDKVDAITSPRPTLKQN